MVVYRPLSIVDITLDGAESGDFRLQGNCAWRGHTPGTSCTVDVVFAPTATGPRPAVMTIRDSAAGAPHTVAVRGTGS